MNRKTYLPAVTSVLLAVFIAIGVVTCQSEKTAVPAPSKTVEPAPAINVEPMPDKATTPEPKKLVEPIPEARVEPALNKQLKPTLKKKAQPAPKKKIEPAPAETVESTPQRPKRVFTVAVEGATVAKVQVSPVEEGGKSSALIKTTAEEGHYLNEDYPWTLTIESSEGLEVETKKYTRGDLTKKTKESFVFKIPFRAPHETKIKANLKMGVCDKKAGTCSIKKVSITW